jgi:hypothetical protein
MWALYHECDIDNPLSSLLPIRSADCEALCRGARCVSLVSFLEQMHMMTKITCKSGTADNSGAFTILHCLLKDAYQSFSCAHPKSLRTKDPSFTHLGVVYHQEEVRVKGQ